MNDMFVDTHKAVVESKRVYESISKNPLSFLDELPKLSTQLLPKHIMAQIGGVLGNGWDSLETFSNYSFKMYSDTQNGDLYISIIDKKTDFGVCFLNMTQKQVEYVILSTRGEPTKTLSDAEEKRVDEIHEELKKLKPGKLQAILDFFLPPTYRNTMESCLKSELESLLAKKKQNMDQWDRWNKAETYVQSVNETTLNVLLPIFSAHGFDVQRAKP